MPKISTPRNIADEPPLKVLTATVITATARSISFTHRLAFGPVTARDGRPSLAGAATAAAYSLADVATSLGRTLGPVVGASLSHALAFPVMCRPRPSLRGAEPSRRVEWSAAAKEARPPSTSAAGQLSPRSSVPRWFWFSAFPLHQPTCFVHLARAGRQSEAKSKQRGVFVFLIQACFARVVRFFNAIFKVITLS